MVIRGRAWDREVASYRYLYGRRYTQFMATPERVFVVHGRNLAVRDAMFTFLRALGLKPIEWSQGVALTGKGSPYIGDVLDAVFSAAQAVVVVLTPDDIAYLRSEFANGEADPDLEAKGQARPNVLFEAGMALGRAEDRTILVECGDLRRFTDVDGRHTVRMNNTPQMRKSLADRLKGAGCPVDTSGQDWMTAGDFTPPSGPGDGLPLGKRIPRVDRIGPKLDGHWFRSGGNRFDEVKLTNSGAVTLHRLNLVVPEALRGHLQFVNDGAVQKLPAGKTATFKASTSLRYHGGGGPGQFELLAIGELEDGTPFEQEVYFDAG